MIKFELNESNYLILKVNGKVRDDFQYLLSGVEKYYKKHFGNDYLTMLNKNISSINTIPALKDYMKYIMNQYIIELGKEFLMMKMKMKKIIMIMKYNLLIKNLVLNLVLSFFTFF